MAEMTITLSRDTTGIGGSYNETFTFIPVPRIDEGLNKKVRSRRALDVGKTIVHDHLQNDKTWVLTYKPVTDNPPGSGHAWAKKRAFYNAMQLEGKIWKLHLEDTDRGINEDIYVVCKSIQSLDVAGHETNVPVKVTLLETDNWEGIP